MKILERLVEELCDVELIQNSMYNGIRITQKDGDRKTKTTSSELYAYVTSEGKRKLSFMVDSEQRHVEKYTARIKGTELGDKILSQLNTVTIPTLHQPYFGISIEVESLSKIRELVYSYLGKTMPAKRPDPDPDAITAQSL